MILWNIHDSSRLLTFKGHKGLSMASSSPLPVSISTHVREIHGHQVEYEDGKETDTFEDMGVVYSCCLTSDDKFPHSVQRQD